MKIHELKTNRPHFGLIRDGLKCWELRRNDRGFEVGDLLWLREYDPTENDYTDRTQLVEIMRVTADFDVTEGLPASFVIMDIERRCLVLPEPEPPA